MIRGTMSHDASHPSTNGGEVSSMKSLFPRLDGPGDVDSYSVYK